MAGRAVFRLATSAEFCLAIDKRGRSFTGARRLFFAWQHTRLRLEGLALIRRAEFVAKAARQVTQTHWFRLAGDKISEHWANRDDMGSARQLGWIPPSPLYLLRMVLATRRVRRHRPNLA